MVKSRPYYEKLNLALSMLFRQADTSHSVLYILCQLSAHIRAFTLTYGINKSKECFFPIIFSCNNNVEGEQEEEWGLSPFWSRYIELKGDDYDGISLSSVYQLETHLSQVLKFDLNKELPRILVKNKDSWASLQICPQRRHFPKSILFALKRILNINPIQFQGF